MVGILINLITLVIVIVAGWKMYEKAGQKGWAYIIPIYSLVIQMRIIGKPGWWWLLMLIPIYNIYIWYKISQGMARSYGFSDGWTWLHFFLQTIFVLIAGFKSDVTYAGPAFADEKKAKENAEAAFKA